MSIKLHNVILLQAYHNIHYNIIMKNEIYDFIEITDRLQQCIKESLNKQKVYDKDMATALGVTPLYYAVIKRRKKILFEDILYYCHMNNVDINWILFGVENFKESKTL